MRLAIVDMLFSWPPRGGGDVDVFHTALGLHAAGHDICLFGMHLADSWEFGAFEPKQLPFCAELLEMKQEAERPEDIAQRFRNAVDSWQPEAVFVCDGFFLKPYVVNALAGYPIALRYYAHEVLCHRCILRYKDHAPCPNSYLETPEICRACALDGLAPAIRRDAPNTWVREYLAAKAYAPEYYSVVKQSLRAASAAIVYNEEMRAALSPFCREVYVVPGGVDSAHFTPSDAPKQATPRKVILMTGRGEDPVKGASVLYAAGEILAKRRSDFEIRVTMPEDTPATGWWRPIGWRDHAALSGHYREADIAVVPSIWEEPFGLVALEAMAAGLPLCVSRVGGLQDIVRHHETGFIFNRADSQALAECLERLLDDEALRRRMGQAGRRRVEEHYTWQHVIETCYPPILARLQGQSAGITP